MDKMIVVVFENEERAFQGLQAIEQLNNEGNIAVYSSAVITKRDDGKLFLHDAEDEGPLGTSVGLLIGSMIGLLGGPAGLAIGATGGALIGSIDDFKKAGVNAEFLDEISHHLIPGCSAVVAEVAENWTAPLNSQMEPLGGLVFRCRRAEVIEDQLERRIEAEKAELAELKAECEMAVGDAKNKLHKSIEHIESKLKSAMDHARHHAHKLEKEAEAKINSLESRLAKANSEAKAKFESHIDAIRRDYDSRIQKLKQAASLTAEAFV